MIEQHRDGSFFGKIIDAHGHVYPDKIALKASEAIGAFYGIPMRHVGTAAKLRETAAAAGIRKQLICSAATVPEQVEQINNFIHSVCEEEPMFIGFGTMHPDYPDFEKELARIKALGLRGVKLHTDFQMFNIDDARAFPMYRAIVDAEIPVLFHMGDEKRIYSEPRQLRRIKERFPELVAIAAHFGGHQKWAEAEAELSGIGVYFDTSSTLAFLAPERAADMIGALGEDNFFYGTDFPMWDHVEELERFMRLPLSDLQREKILYKNFEAVIKI